MSFPWFHVCHAATWIIIIRIVSHKFQPWRRTFLLLGFSVCCLIFVRQTRLAHTIESVHDLTSNLGARILVKLLPISPSFHLSTGFHTFSKRTINMDTVSIDENNINYSFSFPHFDFQTIAVRMVDFIVVICVCRQSNSNLHVLLRTT